MIMPSTTAIVIILISISIVSLFFRLFGNPFRGLFSAMINIVHHGYRSSSLFHLLGRIFFDRKCPKNLDTLEPVEQVAKNIWRVLGLNPGSHTLQGTNTWLIGNGTSKVLIDTGEDITSKVYTEFLIDTVFPLTKTTSISKILLTHGHGDHQGGVLKILKELKKLGIIIPKIYKRQILDGNFPCGKYVCEDIQDGECFNCSDSDEAIVLKAIFTPGHTDDHVAFLLQEEDTCSLFSGDCVLGCGTTVFDDLYEYMKSLGSLRDLMTNKTQKKTQNMTLNNGSKRMEDVKERDNSLKEKKNKGGLENIKIDDVTRSEKEIVTIIYPGHGPVIRGENKAIEKIDEYISHRNKREEQILEILQKLFLLNQYHKQNNNHDNNHNKKTNTFSPFSLVNNTYDNYLSSWQIMIAVYGKLPFFIQISAQWNVLHHLNKLLKDEKIVFLLPDLWSLAPLIVLKIKGSKNS